MASTARSRGFATFNMPSGSNDEPNKQPISNGFPAADLYTNKSIWNTPYSNSRDRSIAAKGQTAHATSHALGAHALTKTSVADDNHNPSGSSALNANSEAVGWSTGPGRWNTIPAAAPSNAENPPRSVSTSPNRTRDGAMPNGTGFFDSNHAAIGMKKAPYPGAGFSNEANGYGAPFGQQKRSPQEATFLEGISTYAPTRDHSVPPSRQSQGSPGFEAYPGHTPKNSVSQRHMHHQSASFSAQTANQRAFNMNKQMEDDLSLHFSRRMGLDNTTNGASAINVPPQFQLNPDTQPWTMAEASAPRVDGAFDLTMDPIVSAHHLNGIKRQSIDRISPAPGYRLDASNGGARNYAPTPDPWIPRPSSRDPRTSDFERRAPSQHYLNTYAQSYYPNPNQYPFTNLPAPYPPNYIDPYAQGYRHPMVQSYAVQSLPGGYPLAAANLAPIRSSREQDPSKGMRSTLLEDFRANNKSSKRYELKDIYNYVVEFSGDQHGSRFIQQKLETANSDEKDQVFREIEPNAIQLMKDVFGNYVVQKFFEHGNQVQKKVLAEKMRGKVVDLSTQVYACRVVQKALEHVLVEQQAELTKELQSQIVQVIRDQNGNHVVQKIIELVPRQYIDFIMDALRGQVTALASHTYGCRVIQRMLEHGTEADKADIMTELHASIQILITDQYGNYVTQHVIQNGKPEDRAKIIDLVMAQLLTLSKHKFASNVVEKCIEFGSAEQRSSVREQLTTVGSDGTSPLKQMMRDQYGNYVIQKLLGQLRGSERESFVEDIKPQFFDLKRNGASRQLQALEKLLGVSAKTDATDTNSAAPTPVLTNETNSPQSSSPPSTHSSAVEAPVGSGAKATPVAANGVGPQVHGEEA